MKSKKVAILDYGIGNHASIKHSLRTIGLIPKITKNIEDLDESRLIILPGVGSFPEAMSSLINNKLIDYIQDASKKGRSILGICLGMQLLATSSNEIKETSGLDIIPGVVENFEDLRVHVGWNSLHINNKLKSLMEPFDKSYVYFNHGYYYLCDEKYIVSYSDFQKKFPSIICSKKTVGVQFHPEKSQIIGVKILKKLILNLIND